MPREQAHPTVSREVLLSLQLQEKDQEIEYLRKVSYERLVTIQILAESKRAQEEALEEMRRELEALRSALSQLTPEMPPSVDWEDGPGGPIHES